MPASPARPVTVPRVLRLWWPLAASWLLMGVELPMVAAVVARLPDPRVHLAAYGSVVFPISLVIEGPIIMLLAASTALSRDLASYRRLYRYMTAASVVLTAVHVAVAFTPLYEVVAVGLLDAHPDVVEPGRIGLRLMTPWTWAIAHRRFQQGLLIRFERSRLVGVGTLVRLVANAAVLFLGWKVARASGIVVAASAVATGVVAEMLYVAACARAVVRGPLRAAPAVERPVTRASFLRFYVPLAATPVLTLLVQPLAAAGMNRMPLALASLAAWPAVWGLVFLPRSVGLAYNEVVVALLGEPGAVRVLRRFAVGLAATTSALLVLFAATPLARLWFQGVSGLEPDLVALARVGVAIAVVMPAYQALQSWYTGALVHERRTRAVTEAVAVYLTVAGTLLVLGASLDRVAGLPWAVGSLVTAGIAQTAWLARRSRATVRAIARATPAAAAPAETPGAAT